MRLSDRARLFIGAALAFALMLGFSASVVNAQDASPEAGNEFPTTVTFVNALTSLDSVDVYINGDREEQRVIEGLAYGAVSEQFAGTAPGTVVVIKQNVNWGVDRYLFSTLVPTAAGKNYVVTISDFFLIPVELNTSPTDDGSARTVAVHAAAQAPAVDVFATPAGGQIGVAIITDLSYGNVTESRTPGAGSYDVVLMQAGTETVALEQSGIEIGEATSNVLILIGKPGSTEQPLTILTVSAPTA